MEAKDLKEKFYSDLAILEQRFSVQQPELELTVRDSSIDLEGYVVVWNSRPGLKGTLGPCGKGGTRITPQTSLEEIKMLAKTMALKNAAADLAMGGAKSGIKADPDSADFEKKYRRFLDLIKPILCENGGIFGGMGFDIGARPIHPVWACDQLKSYRSFTGKPVEMGGTDYDREGIAGLGVAVATKTLLFERGVSKASVAIQGLGAMGAAVFRYLSEYGFTISYVSDPRIGGCFKLPELISEDLLNAISIQDFDKTKALLKNEKSLDLEQVLYQEVDVLIPSAVQGVITEANSGKIKAKYIIEGANNPTSALVQKELQERGHVIIPDFIANPGGIIAAYVELTSKITPEENSKTRKNVHDAKELTKSKISQNVQKIIMLSKEYHVDLISCSRMLALNNILN